MAGIQTEYEFVLPRGYIDEAGALHKRGVMRLATARDELQPLRDPTISGPDDPRLTILVLARVVKTLGTMPMVTPHEIEGLFAVDLAYLQDYYGVINFGSAEDIEAVLAAQRDDAASTSEAVEQAPPTAQMEGLDEPGDDEPVENRGARRRAAIEEVPSSRE
jgi:hypothetical protein